MTFQNIAMYNIGEEYVYNTVDGVLVTYIFNDCINGTFCSDKTSTYERIKGD